MNQEEAENVRQTEKRLRDMTDGELIALRNKVRREGNKALMCKIMRKLMRRGQTRSLKP